MPHIIPPQRNRIKALYILTWMGGGLVPVHAWLLPALPCNVVRRAVTLPKIVTMVTSSQKIAHLQSSLRDVESDDDENMDVWDLKDLEVVDDLGDPALDGVDEAWIPDADKAKRRGDLMRRPLTPTDEYFGKSTRKEKNKQSSADNEDTMGQKQDRESGYSEEERQIIEALGGTSAKPSVREPGYLGDFTLKEISLYYSVPICYLADILCMWKVPVPININDRLGDLVNGEQAFAILEAINSYETPALAELYSNDNLMDLCTEYEIDLKEALQYAMKENWSLPFGVRTHLRMEEQEKLIRVFVEGDED